MKQNVTCRLEEGASKKRNQAATDTDQAKPEEADWLADKSDLSLPKTFERSSQMQEDKR